MTDDENTDMSSSSDLWAGGVSEPTDDHPDDVDLVVEVSDMMAIFAADRFRRVSALTAGALADAARHGRTLTDVVERGIRLELAAALRITEHAAGELLSMAEALVHRYPDVLDSLGRARMTERHAQVVVAAVDSVEPDLRAHVLDRAIALAETESVGSLRRALARLVETVQAQTLTERHETAVRERRIVVEHAHDSMAWIHALVPAVEAHAIHRRVTRIATALAAGEDETRTLDELRADAFCDLLIDGEAPSMPAEARGIRATVVVTVPVLALLDQDAPIGGVDGAEPAVVEGLGPIPIDRARELCGGADGWMRVLTHPETGMVLSVGREQYRPPAALRRLVRWRADRCMAPGCGMPAARCQIDHTIAWEHGGETSLANTAPMCQGHHTVKHHGGWCVVHVPGSGGALEWTSPSGRRYIVRPERRVPVFTPSPRSSEPVAPF
ncbi:DUF222 domain-containing protein [Planococcus sp. APC 4015]|nr:DUF222 domain-containing protein [Planococcus sp. APC 4015]